VRFRDYAPWTPGRLVPPPKLTVLAGAIALAAATPALAQTVPPLAAPEAIFNQVPAGSPIPRILPPELPTVSPGAGMLPPQSPGGEVPSAPVTVATVSVEGVTVYSDAVMAQAVAGLVGPAVPLSTIEAARTAILRRYRDDGYPLTAVSVVRDSAGALHFRVTEGHIADVKLDGDIGPAGVQVLRFLTRLTEPKAITAATLERYLLLAQDVPGVTLRAVLRPSVEEPGALTLVAQVSRAPMSGLVTADNQGFNKAGPEESLVVYDFNSFTAYGERSEISLYRTFNSTQIFGQASEEFYLGSSGLRLRVYAGAGDSQPSGQLRAAGYDGITRVFGGQLTYPIIRARQQTLNIVGVLDALESEIDTGTPPYVFRNSYDSLRVFRTGVDYAMSDIWAGNTRPATNGVIFRMSQGVNGLGADTNQTRPGERVDFFKANIDITRTQTLFEPTETSSVALMGIVSGQITPNLLPPAEQFYLGGSRITRGFYSGEVTGDNALAATIELQYNTSAEITAFGHTFDISPQFYGFYDWGETWENQKTDLNHRLQSFGGGVRLNITRYVEVDVEGVKRLTRYPTGNSPGVSALPGEALYWRVLTHF
jgi:hemolysin activation/secretion protein